MTDLNKERMELELSAGVLDRQIDNLKAEIADEYFDDEKLELLIEYSMKLGEVYAQRDILDKAKAQAVPEHIVTLQRNGEVFKFDLLDLLRRSLKSSKVLKTRENWSHVSKMVGIGSTTATLLCKEMNVDPDGTLFEASESGAEG